MLNHSTVIGLVCVGVWASGANRTQAEVNTQSDGSDGALNCAWLAKSSAFDCGLSCFEPDPKAPELQPCTFVVDLSKAQTAPGVTWLTPGGDIDGDGFGDGVYDPTKWAVVYKFTTIDIPANVIVKFVNHPSGAPVVWLAQGDVSISGTVNVGGQDGFATQVWPDFSEPGPGGFPGGAPADRSTFVGSIGYGPGSSPDYDGYTNACHSGRNPDTGTCSPSYGNHEIFPLIGGSGGGVTIQTSHGGYIPTTAGAGGGAILIATDSIMNLEESSRITAHGGTGVCINNPVHQPGGHGSGGAIRLVAGTSMTAMGYISASGGGWTSCSHYGGLGRVRLEAPLLNTNVDPNPTLGVTTSIVPGEIFPGPSAPTLEVVSISDDGMPILAPSDPLAGPETVDIGIDTDQSSTVVIRATNIPVGTRVDVRVIPIHGNQIIGQSTMLQMQPDGTLLATRSVVFPAGRSEIQLRANWTP